MKKEEFYNSIQKWIAAPKETWNHITIMAYFYHKYEQKNGVRYMPAHWKIGPGSTKECKDIKKVFDMFAPEDYKDLPKERKDKAKLATTRKMVNYINWTFDYKYRYDNKGRAVTTQFLLAPYAINEFQIMYNNAMKKSKSKNTIKKLVFWCQDQAPSVLDNHELESTKDIQMIMKYAEMYTLPESSDEMKMISQAKKMGLV